MPDLTLVLISVSIPFIFYQLGYFPFSRYFLGLALVSVCVFVAGGSWFFGYKYIKNKFINPAKKIPSINIISLDDFENAATKSKVINKNKANSKIDSISKSELVKFLWDIVGEKIYSYKYSTNVSKEEGEHLENDGLAKILKKIRLSI